MSQLVTLGLGAGTCQQGFPSVTAQLWVQNASFPIKFAGSLPPEPELARLYKHWRTLYQALHLRLNWRQESNPNEESRLCQADTSENRFAFDYTSINRVSGHEFHEICQQLKRQLNTWLQSPDFFTIDQRLRLQIEPTASIKFIIETDDQLVRQLPWHLWSLLESCPQAEVAFSAQTYEQNQTTRLMSRDDKLKKARVLAILGHSSGIDIQQDRDILEQLPNSEVVFLSEPDRATLDRWLWDTRGWDILFFAGHSSSHSEGKPSNSGYLNLNPSETISIEQLHYALRAAIDRGLQLAIFNSCDGLGLAQALENLHLPQMIVMREPVPDQVAQHFLRNLTHALASGHLFYPAVRMAREQLQGIESKFPCASWLPTLCQNPSAPSFVWPCSTVASQLETIETQNDRREVFEPGPTPYKGLAAFEEGDGNRYFGRSHEVQVLWEKFRQLQKDSATIRLLPIYGPSGSGKSSLAKAGLLALLGQPTSSFQPHQHLQPQARIVTLVPGTDPSQALAKTLAQIVEDDSTPVRKSREFATELAIVNTAGAYDGLQRIVAMLPDARPLTLLIDQFEEIYSLCSDGGERDIFLGNLLFAAGHQSRLVSVIITFRSDFLGATHQHPAFNHLFSAQGFLVPAMGREGLREAIAQPALNAGYTLDEATINLLIEQTEGRDGALPLLQFALTRIWEGLSAQQKPIQTLKEVGGVGGALAAKAQHIFEGLNNAEQDIARRLFLGLVQLGEGTRDTRRRVALNRLISAQDDPVQVNQVINLFSAPGVRLVTRSMVDQQETVEVTHEALFEHWQQLNLWLDKGRDDLRFQRRLDESAQDWAQGKCANGLLWRKPNLDLLRSYHQRAKSEMTPLQIDFFTAAQKLENRQKRLNRSALGVLLLLTVGLAGFGIIANRSAAAARRSRQSAQGREFLLQSEQLTAQKGFTSKETGALLAVKALQNFQAIGLEPPTEINHALYGSLITPSIIFQAEDDWINGVAAFSPDRRQVVLVCSDNKVKVWDIETQQQLAEFPHDGAINSIAFSPDGTKLATANDDEIARVWDLKSQQLVAQFSHSSSVSDVAFNPDSKTIATTSENKITQVWDIQTQRSLVQLPHPELVNKVLFHPDGTQLATATTTGFVQVWDLKTRNVLADLVHESAVNDFSFSPDGQHLATAGTTGTTQVWAIATQSITVTLPHDGSVLSVDFSPSGEQLATASTDETTRIWNLKTQQVVASLPDDIWVKKVAFSPDGTQLATASAENTARLWDLEAWRAETRFHHDASVYALDISADGIQMVTASSDGKARIWDLKTGAVLQVLQHDANIFGIVFSPDGTQVATASADQTAKVWSVATGQVLTTLPHDDWVFDIDFSPDGRQVATASSDTLGRVWDIKTGEVAVSLAHDGPIYGIEFSPNGATVVTGGAEKKVEVWDLKTGQSVRSLPHAGVVIDASFNSDGSLLATTSDDSIGRIWDVSTGQLRRSLKHDDTVLGISFSPDDTKIATASDDRTVKVWDMNTGEALTSLPHGGQVTEVIFSLDGANLFSASLDASARLWSFRSASDLADEVCQRLSRNLSAQEWERHMRSELSQYELICDNLPIHPSVLKAAKELAKAGK